MISMDKQYRTRDGREVRLYAIDAGGYFPIHGAYLRKDIWYHCSWTKDGSNHYIEANDLIEVKPRIQREYWVNVYRGNLSGYYTKEGADSVALPDRIACVKITIDCEEGEGL